MPPDHRILVSSSTSAWTRQGRRLPSAKGYRAVRSVIGVWSQNSEGGFVGSTGPLQTGPDRKRAHRRRSDRSAGSELPGVRGNPSCRLDIAYLEQARWRHQAPRWRIRCGGLLQRSEHHIARESKRRLGLDPDRSELVDAALPPRSRRLMDVLQKEMRFAKPDPELAAMTGVCRARRKRREDIDALPRRVCARNGWRALS